MNMSTPSGRHAWAGREWVFQIASSVLGFVVAFAAVEVALRVRLGDPRPPQLDILIEPGGRYQAPDPALGFKPLPGRYVALFDRKDAWTLTNLPDTTRVTKPLERYRTDMPRPGIWIFGCSFVQGWGLDDEGTLPWKVQERFPDYDVVNFGVGGYGTLQSLIQYRQALAARPKPALAILVYADFHDERNVRTDGWRDANFNYSRFGTTSQPYARLDASGGLSYAWGDGRVPLMGLRVRSAAFNYAVVKYGRIRERFLDAHRVSELLIDQFIDESRRQGVRVILAGTWPTALTRETLRGYAAQGIETVDISSDFNDPRNRIARDGHPSASANDRSASLLADVIRGRSSPRSASAR